MKKQSGTTWLSSTACTAVLVMSFVLVCGSVAAQQQGTVADKLAAALVHFNDLDYDEGLAVASGLMKRTDLSSQDSVAIYEVMSIITYGMGEKYRDDAIAYLNRISHIGPCVIHLPREMWPSGLRDKWYKISNAAGALTCSDESKPGVKTIAIMEFDNYSIGEYKEKLELIGKGLADWFESDFRKISSLRVVERDKIAFVLKEIELQKSGAVDKSTAVKVGKILGAQYMVFGSVTQLDSKNTRMVVRVVSVETSEIIASVDKEGKPEYPRLEKGLVEEMAGLLDIKLSDDTKSLIREGGTESFDAATFYAKGIDFMDRYEYKKAYEHFKKAYELDTDFVEAKRKMEIYRPYAI